MNRSRLVGPARLVVTAAAGAAVVALATLAPAEPLSGLPGSGAAAGPTGPESGSASTLAPVSSAALTCPGPELTGVDGVDDIGVPAQVGAATAPESVLPTAPRGDGTLVVGPPGTPRTGPTPERGETLTRPAPAGRRVDITATGSLAPGLAASQEWVVARAEIRGLATVPCAQPGSDLWLLAGGGAPGRQERLVLTNPGANEVTVDLEVLGRDGPVAVPSSGTVVPARGRVALLVDAVTGAEESPAVRVRVTGGAVRAVLTDTWLDGSMAAGAESTVPVAQPSTRQVIPAAVMGLSGSIRVAVPGPRQAVLSARVLGPDGPTPLPKGGVARIDGQSTGELSLEGLEPGTYAVEVTSDVPVVASMWSTWRRGDATGDFIWAPATEAVTDLLGGAYPVTDDGVRRTASVVASRAPATVQLTWRSGDDWRTRTIDLAQDTAVTVDLGAAESVWVRRTGGSGEVRASVVGTLGSPNAPLRSVAPLTETAVTSAVSRAYPRP